MRLRKTSLFAESHASSVYRAKRWSTRATRWIHVYICLVECEEMHVDRDDGRDWLEDREEEGGSREGSVCVWGGG